MAALFIILSTLALPTLISGCPLGFLQHGENCYFFSIRPANSWAEANSFCLSFGYKLAETETPLEVNFIKGILSRMPGTTRYFLGGSDLFVEGEWIWSSSQTLITPHNWEPGEPNNNANEDCISVNHDGLWNDVPCDLKIPYICQAEAGAGNIIG